MIKKLHIYVLFLFALSVVAKGQSQSVYHLTIEQSIDLAKEKSFEMRLLQQDLKRYKYELTAATSRFKTNIDLNITAPDYRENINQITNDDGDNIFINQRSAFYNTNLTINQPLPTDGNLFIRSGIANTDNFEFDSRSFELNTRLMFNQPIDALYGFNNILAEFKTAKLNYELSLKRFKRAELKMIYDISLSYYELQRRAARRNIAKDNLQRMKESNELAQKKFNAGLIREVEALQLEVDYGRAQNDYDLSIVNYEGQLNKFKYELGISLTDSVSLNYSNEYTVIFIEEQKALDLATRNRTEIREREISIELSEIEIKRRKAERMPKGDISAYYQLKGVDGSYMVADPISLSYQGALDNLANRPGDFGVALTLRIPIFDWGRTKARINAAEAILAQNQISLESQNVLIEQEVKNTLANLRSSLRRLQLLEKNVKLAESSFEISTIRFKNGDITSETLALDRNRLNQTYIDHLNALISYKLLLADIKRQTFYDFEQNRSMLEEDETLNL